jgi:CubicO group peptidase (beta-lactamase class C family)
VLGIQVCFGLGYGLPGGMMPLPSANSMFWGGWGGSLVIIDYDRRMTMAYAMNKMVSTTTGDARVGGLVMGVYGALLS